jgi:pyrroline-5-carboxylate reductase
MNIIAFIGGGNMATAIIGGLLRGGRSPSDIFVLEPQAEQRSLLQRKLGVITLESPGSVMQRAELVVWAIKPQHFKLAAQSCADQVQSALQLSVMAGIRSDAISRTLGTQRVVRAMPNTPALVGKGMTGLYARPEVSRAENICIEQVLSHTGDLLWVEKEADLDAVTALSGSGPAYVFYFLQAMIEAAKDMGFSAEQGKQLALTTFAGATALAKASPESPEFLRERVTSKGGTTFAAIESLEHSGVKAAIVKAIHAAQRKAGLLGDEFGA